ncbi:zinc-finger double domain-containing protein [Phthorimaea operculella]|nr:zinc-finger double domain-containing protein [Phthorimaea operculella]
MQSSRTKNKSKYVVNTLCFGCLSADRKLYKLLQFKDVFKQICKNVVLGGRNTEISLCFECMALIRNVKNFQDKVQTSQNILKNLKQNSFEQQNITNLSNLSTTTAIILDSSKFLAHEYAIDEETKPQLILNNIKIEEKIYNHEDYFNAFDYGEDDTKIYDLPDIHNDETLIVNETKRDFDQELIKDGTLRTVEHNHYEPIIKIEGEDNAGIQNIVSLPPEKKQAKKKQSNKEKLSKKEKSHIDRIKYEKSWYKIIRLNNPNSTVYQEVKIPYEQIKYWLEKERNNILFKSLNRRYKCEKCAKKMKGKKSQLHLSRHSQNLQYCCDYCTLSFAKKVRLVNHIKAHSYIKSCNMCDYKCVSEFLMYKHVEKDHAITRAVQCVECKSHFKRLRDFHMHYRDHHYELNHVFICDYCNKKCKTRRTIEKHIYNNHTPHRCPKCSLVFKETWRLAHHYSLKHSVSPTEATYCVKCDRQFDNLLQYRYHLNTSVAHRDERKPPKLSKSKQPVQCLACPKMYSKRFTMMNHYNKVHVGKSRYQCADCNKLFTNNTHMKDHIRYHHEGQVKERKHICKVCGRGFTDKQILENHIRTHTGERPFECPHCPAKFTQKFPLVVHMKKIHMAM